MNCQEFAALLDEQGTRSFSADERVVLQAHAHDCVDCGAALIAAHALGADPVPARNYTFDVGRLAPVESGLASPGSRIRRTVAVVAAIGVGAAVFASVAWWASDPDREILAPDTSDFVNADSTRAGGAPADSFIDFVDAQERAAQQTFSDALLATRPAPDGEYFALLKNPPRYPEAAAAAGLEGNAVVEFTVLANGSVSDVEIVSSSDPIFEATTIAAAAVFKYKPRVVDGEAVDVSGVRNRIVYVLDPEQPETVEAEPAERAEPSAAAADLEALLAPAMGCLQAGELRCVELRLDEVVASIEMTAQQRWRVQQIYGLIHYRRGNYQQAIGAYRQAAQEFAGESHYGYVMPLMVVARIYYEQQQYQPAFEVALEYLRHHPSPTTTDHVFVDRLRELGATLP